MEAYMTRHKLGNAIAFILALYTIIDVSIHIRFIPIRSDVLATFPMVGEAISEGFNVVFAIVILLILSYGYKKGRPILTLILGSSFFYISQLHDFFDEFFVLNIPSIAFEVFAFPLALIFAAIGIYATQRYQNKLNEENETLKVLYKNMSITDSLTGLFNTRHFYDTVPVVISETLNRQGTLSLMILDIDDFKEVNDTYGHLEGDRLISFIGGLIKEHFDEGDNCFRYGGEEFVVVLKNLDVEKAMKKASIFKDVFGDKIFSIDDITYKKTISVGLSTLDSIDNVKTLLDKADKAMYDAKTTGKNKICIR